MWVREQYTYVLFTENWSNVAATVHVPYMNSSRKWEKTREKKKKKRRKTQQTGNAGNAGNANPNASLNTSLSLSPVRIYTFLPPPSSSFFFISSIPFLLCHCAPFWSILCSHSLILFFFKSYIRCYLTLPNSLFFSKV